MKIRNWGFCSGRNERMSYELNDFFAFDDSNQGHSRVLVYPNQIVAAKLLNHRREKGAEVIFVADCVEKDPCRLPMPNDLMGVIDELMRGRDGHFIVAGLEPYLALLKPENVVVFMGELRRRLDEDTLRVDYLLSCNHRFPFAPRYEEARKIIFLDGEEETAEIFRVLGYCDKWARQGENVGYGALLRRIDPFHFGGAYTVFLPEIDLNQAGLGKALTFVTDVHEIAERLYGIDVRLADAVLEKLLLEANERGQGVEAFLRERFGDENCTPRQALNRLLALQKDDLWPAYVWFAKRRLPEQSYIVRVLSEKVDADKLLWNYAVGTALSVLSDVNARQYASERAEALKVVANSIPIEPLIIEFITSARECANSLQFLNCGTFSEKAEIVRRAAREDLSHGLPQQYACLYPALADYMAPYDWGNREITVYFQEYRKLKLSDNLTETFMAWAYEASLPAEIPARDYLLETLRPQRDTALLVVDALGIEYLPVLTAMAARCGLNLKPPQIAWANIPTTTEFNPIKWDPERILAPVKGLDNIVHDGKAKHEKTPPECCFTSTLHMIETDVLNRISDGLSRFSRVVVTADHGATRLASVARRDGKARTLPWSQRGETEPLDWRYSTAWDEPRRPEECESQYFPDSEKTYWVVRGYHRLPKRGGKKYALHGGASLEERLVPILVFTRKADPSAASTKVPTIKQPAELKDAFEGLI